MHFSRQLNCRSLILEILRYIHWKAIMTTLSIQCGVIITWSIFAPNPHKRWGMGCLLWVWSLIYVLLLSSQCRWWYHDKLDRVITALDCNWWHRPHSRQVTGARCTGGRGSPVMSWIFLKANNGPLDPGVGDKRFFHFKRNALYF